MYFHIFTLVRTLIIGIFYFVDFQVEASHYARKLVLWMQKGFPELADLAGLGIGATTHKILMNREFKNAPHEVCIESV